jgi:hypothetical protein
MIKSIVVTNRTLEAHTEAYQLDKPQTTPYNPHTNQQNEAYPLNNTSAATHTGWYYLFSRLCQTRRITTLWLLSKIYLMT